MAARLNLPSVVGLNLENTSPGMVTFLQAVQDSLKTIDSQVVYKDQVNINVPAVRLRAKSAQGQGFSVQGVNVASGDDYANLVRDFEILLQDVNALRQYLVIKADQLAEREE